MTTAFRLTTPHPAKPRRTPRPKRATESRFKRRLTVALGVFIPLMSVAMSKVAGTLATHGHWAVGHIDGFSIRVFKDGEITPAFRTYHALAERMANYPILDESDYSQKEYDATLANITHAAHRLRHEYALPDGWEGDVFSWFWDHDQRAVENRDDQGGYPSEDDLRSAFDALGYEQIEE